MNKKVLKTLEYHKILNMIASLADSEPGRERVLNLHPISSKEKIKQLLKQTDDAVNRLFRKGKPDFTHVVDVTDMLKRLKAESSLNAAELLAIAELLICAEDAVKYYEDLFEDSLTAMYSSLDPITTLSRSIKKCIISEDHIASNASPTLAQIRKSQEETKDRITTELNRMLSSPSVRECLQDVIITSRQGRYCLPVKAEYKRRITGMIHDRSATGSTLFIEPSIVVNLNNELKQLEIDEKKEIEKILKKLSEETAEYTEVIFEDFRTLSILDFIYAKASWCKNNKCSMPEINLDNYVDLKTARHPLIPADKVVPIDIHIGNDFSTLVITGPNTGGKTVTLKTVGLLCLLAYSGLLIPSDVGSKVAVFKEIFADIGDEQSIEQSLSTFSAHMTNISGILKHSNEKSLVLFDELGAGTDPTEGAALATSILDNLLKKHITTIATTHYSELKMYALTTPGVVNAGCEFNIETLQPTYKLLIGVPGKSNAFAISKKLGISDYIIDNAQKRLTDNEVAFEDIITDLDAAKRKAQSEEAEIKVYKQEIERLREEIKHERQKTNDSKNKILQNANEQAANILAEAKAFADKAIKVMNTSGVTVKELEEERSKLREKTKMRQEKSVSKAPAKKKSTDKPEDYKPGVRVLVHDMDSYGEILTPPDKKNECTVLIGNFKLKQNIRNLQIDRTPQPKEKKTETSSSYASKIRSNKSRSISPEINLLGMTVDEAIGVLDKYLDDAYLAGVAQVRIVHGKGTGALKKGISQYLSGLPYVSNFRLGIHGEGEDGVTIVTF